MTVKAGWCTPMLHAKSIEDSIQFYQRLGFEVVDTDDCGNGEPLGWARIHCEGGALMFLRAEHPRDPHAPGAMFTMYTPDLPALREQLIAAGLDVSPIKYPGYMPSGEAYVKDPDGNIVELVHWSDKEHTAWLKRIGKSA